MTPLRIVFLVALATLPPATARADVSVMSLATVGDGPFAPGGAVDATLTLRNDGNDAVDLRRIVLRASDTMRILDPASDTLDNDGDGETDEDDESFRRGGAWRFDGESLRLDPGDTLTRTLRLAVAKTALPGSAPTLTVSAGSILPGASRGTPQATRRTIEIPLVAAVLSLKSSDGDTVSVLNEPVVTGTVALPGGILTDAALTITLPPAASTDSVGSYRVGTAIDCDADPVPTVKDGRATLALGRCTVDGAASARDRSIRMAVPLALKDAPPGATDTDLAAWRTISVSLEAIDGETVFGRETLTMALRGARPAIDLTLPIGRRYRVGDPVAARVTVENRGDLLLSGARLAVANDEAFRCVSVTFDGDDDPQPCEDGGFALPTLMPGDGLDLTLVMRLRDDALFEAGTGPELMLTGEAVGSRRIPGAPIAMALHDAPSLEIADRGDLTEEGTQIVATIGHRAGLRLTGTLPPGRYRGAVRLMARVLDFGTGTPVSAAALDIRDTDLAITTVEGERIAKQTGLRVEEGALWSEHALTFDLREDADHGAEKRLFAVDMDIVLPNDPRLVAGRVLELVAETDAYGDNTMTGNTWIAILIEEPDLRLKLLSLDDDRIVEPDERFGILSLACNYGDTAAHGAVLTLDTSARVDLLSDETEMAVFTVPLDDVREGRLADIEAARTALEGAGPRVYERSVALVDGDASLAPESCIGLELRAPLTPDLEGTDTTASALAALDAYTGTADTAKARRYPGGTTAPLRFQAQTLRLGPSTTIQLGKAATVSHPVELSVPEGLGPFRVSLEALSSTGLDWSLRKPGGGGDLVPWTDGATYPAGSTIGIVMRARMPERAPLGWVDTSRLRAEITTGDDRRFGAALRLVLRSGTGSDRTIATEKRIALDRDCDGLLTDERAQDALFEPGKDATLGDCVVVRIGFENVGEREVEKIVIRDIVSARTTLLTDSPTVRIAPEPLDDVSLSEPGGNALEWEFTGLFRPGAVGEVEYRLRLE